jgi:nitrogen fixation NifU-like protein
MLLEEVHDGDLTMSQVMEMDYNEMIDKLGKQIVASRPRCATLGLGTLKAAIRKYQRDRQLSAAGLGPKSEDEGLVFGDTAEEAAKTS